MTHDKVNVKFNGESETVDFDGTFKGTAETYDIFINALKAGAKKSDEEDPTPMLKKKHVSYQANEQVNAKASKEKNKKQPTPLDAWLE